MRKREDLIFEFNYSSQYKYASLEVKGIDGGTSRKHVIQCNSWAEQRSLESKEQVKPVLILNQHRHQPYSGSQSARVEIEYNALKHAISKDVCIIPTPIILNAVNKKLADKARPREEIERLIAEKKGVLIDL